MSVSNKEIDYLFIFIKYQPLMVKECFFLWIGLYLLKRPQINAYKLFNLLKKNNQVEKGFSVLENYLKEKNNLNIRRTLAKEYSKAELFDKAESHYYLLATKTKMLRHIETLQ